eukprot:702-Rhodomonas_salina.1
MPARERGAGSGSGVSGCRRRASSRPPSLSPAGEESPSSSEPWPTLRRHCCSVTQAASAAGPPAPHSWSLSVGWRARASAARDRLPPPPIAFSRISKTSISERITARSPTQHARRRAVPALADTKHPAVTAPSTWDSQPACFSTGHRIAEA